MHRAQAQVREFQKAVTGGPTSPAKPAIRDAALRARLIAEEAAETLVALLGDEGAAHVLDEVRDHLRDAPPSAPDLAEVVDGLCDLLYVAYGTAEALGVDLEPFFDEVHRTNMLKRDPDQIQKRSIAPVGKAIKPAGWEPPRIREMLARVARGEFAEVPDRSAGGAP